MNKIGLATPSWNTEQWIYPFLKLTTGLDKRVIVQGREPLKDHVLEHGVYTTPDRSEALIRKEFPDVQIIYQEEAKFGPEFWNQGHEYLSDMDFVLRFDTDEMILPKDWERLIAYLREVEDIDALKIDFGKTMINYTYDLDHGLKNENDPWLETRGLNTKHRYRGFGDWQGPYLLWEPITVHHYTGWKRKDMDADIDINPKWKPYIEKFGNNGEWFKTPPELRRLFEEGWQKLENL